MANRPLWAWNSGRKCGTENRNKLSFSIDFDILFEFKMSD